MVPVLPGSIFSQRNEHCRGLFHPRRPFWALARLSECAWSRDTSFGIIEPSQQKFPSKHKAWCGVKLNLFPTLVPYLGLHYLWPRLNNTYQDRVDLDMQMKVSILSWFWRIKVYDIRDTDEIELNF